MNEVDVLIQDCTVVTMDRKQPIIEKGVITIKNGHLTHVGKKSRESRSIRAIKAIDGKGKVALPGLVNCHTHAAMTLFRGIAEDKSLDDWLRNTIWPLEAKLTRRDIYHGALLGCLEMIKSGTTCFADMYFHEEVVAKAVEKAGLRAVLSPGIIEAGNPQLGERTLKEAVQVAKKFQDYANGRVTIQLGPHSLYSCSPNLLKRVREVALKLGVGIHIHLAESPDTQKALKTRLGLGEVELLEKLGFLKDLKILAAHCIHLSHEEMRLLAARGVNVVYNPVANMKLGMGVAKINDILRLGVTVGIGTDGPASNNTLDMFESMKIAALLQKVSYRDSTVLPAETVLRMATLDGARALGLEKHVGSLEVNKKADLILVDFNKAHLTPRHDLYANLVYAAHGNDVDTVIVDGKVLMEKRCVKTLNEVEVMKRAEQTAQNLVQR